MSLKKLMSNNNSEKKHYALSNINEQIKLFYSEGYSVKIMSIYNIGTLVYFLIPLLDSPEKKRE